MYDPTVFTMLGLLSQAGISTLRINFRTGIGRGHSAANDIRGACEELLQLNSQPTSIVLVGYSYGSMVVADVADNIPSVVAFALVAPPLQYNWGLFLCRDMTSRAKESSKPKLLLINR